MIYNKDFRWFFGIVEDRHDPLLSGRVRVRCLGLHNDSKTEMPTEDLHWAQVVMPATSASTSGVGQTNGLVEGSYVFGFFIDGLNYQHPIVLGSVQGIPENFADELLGFSDPRTEEQRAAGKVAGRPGKCEYDDFGLGATITEEDPKPSYPRVTDEPDTNRLARNESVTETHYYANKTESRNKGQIGITTAQTVSVSGQGAPGVSIVTAPQEVWNELPIPYAGIYPYNKVTETESGHVIELDDTPASERIHIYHRSGTFEEMHKNGDRVSKTVNDKYEHTQKNSREHVEGIKEVTIDKGMKLLVNDDKESAGKLEIEVGANGHFNIVVSQGDCNLFVNGDVNKHVTGDLNEHIAGSVYRKIGVDIVETIGSNVTRTVGASYKDTIGGSKTVNSASCTENSGSAHTINAGSINLN